MARIRKEKLEELVGGDIFAGGNDRNVVSNSEIETGPVDKPYNDDSDYEKGVATTTDKVFGHYRQNIPWFAVYSFGGTRAGGSQTINTVNEKRTIITKKTVEEAIQELLNKRNDDLELTDKNFISINGILSKLKKMDLTDAQLEELSKAIMDKKTNINKAKTL